MYKRPARKKYPKKKQARLPIDTDVLQRMREAEKLRRQKEQADRQKGFRITGEPAEGRRSLKDFPEQIGMKMFRKGSWAARIEFNGNTLLVEPTPLNTPKNKPKIIVRTPEGNMVECTAKTQKKILKIVAEIWKKTPKSGRQGGHVTVGVV